MKPVAASQIHQTVIGHSDVCFGFEDRVQQSVFALYPRERQGDAHLTHTLRGETRQASGSTCQASAATALPHQFNLSPDSVYTTDS